MKMSTQIATHVKYMHVYNKITYKNISFLLKLILATLAINNKFV